MADFGLTKDIYGTKYYQRAKRRASSTCGKEERVPIWWMAPESIEDEIYTQKTDVVGLHL